MKRKPTSQKAEDKAKKSIPNAAFDARYGSRLSTWPVPPVRFQSTRSAAGKFDEWLNNSLQSMVISAAASKSA